MNAIIQSPFQTRFTDIILWLEYPNKQQALSDLQSAKLIQSQDYEVIDGEVMLSRDGLKKLVLVCTTDKALSIKSQFNDAEIPLLPGDVPFEPTSVSSLIEISEECPFVIQMKFQDGYIDFVPRFKWSVKIHPELHPFYSGSMYQVFPDKSSNYVLRGQHPNHRDYSPSEVDLPTLIKFGVLNGRQLADRFCKIAVKFYNSRARNINQASL